MPDNFKELLQHGMPFMVAAGSGADKVNLTRMLEAVIIAGVIGAGAWLLLLPELKTEFKYISRDVQELKTQVGGLSAEIDHVEKRVDALSVEVVRDRFTRTDFEAWRAKHTDH